MVKSPTQILLEQLERNKKRSEEKKSNPKMVNIQEPFYSIFQPELGKFYKHKKRKIPTLYDMFLRAKFDPRSYNYTPRDKFVSIDLKMPNSIYQKRSK